LIPSLERVTVNLDEDLCVYTVCWRRKGELTGTVKLCKDSSNRFEDSCLPPDVLAEVQKQLHI
tara:strand:+ start:9624 stop:9812 length:189 start_codon:yes stop_codon:yes gene_type:complete